MKEAYLNCRPVRKRALKLQHSTRDLITNAGLATVVSDWCGSGSVTVCGSLRPPSRAAWCACSGCVCTSGVVRDVAGWVSCGGRLDGAGVGIAAAKTGHWRVVSMWMGEGESEEKERGSVLRVGLVVLVTVAFERRVKAIFSD